MFGFGKKKPKPAKKSSSRKTAAKRKPATSTAGAKKAAPVKKTTKPRKTRALCVVCRERTQTNTNLRICGRKRCGTELRQRSQTKPAPAKAAPRRAPATRRPAAPRTRTAPPAQQRPQATPATPKMSTSELATWWQEAQASGQRRQIKDWNHHHPKWRDEIIRNAAALNQAAARLSGPDRAALNDIANAAAAITDDHISRTAEADTAARRPSSTAPRLLALGDRLTALTAKYERAGVIRVNRS